MSPSVAREGPASDFEHVFGGSAESHGIRFVNAAHPFHVLYLLDTTDPMVSATIHSVRFLPLIYGFNYSSNNGQFVYRVINETEIEIVSPTDLDFDPDFPYENYPAYFEARNVGFSRINYNSKLAEDALAYQGVFGIDGLSDSELGRAVEIARSSWSAGYFERFRNNKHFSDWSDLDILQSEGGSPFMQGAPSDSCSNPTCTAEIEEEVEASEIEMPPDLAQLTGQKTIHIDPFVIRTPSLKVIAVHQPDKGDETIWGDPYVQTVFQLCGECGCITTLNQCT